MSLIYLFTLICHNYFYDLFYYFTTSIVTQFPLPYYDL